MIFSDCGVPAENLLGKEGEGFVNSLQILDGGRISIASLGLGMAQGAYEASVRYAKQRKQFGKAIGEFQAIQFKLADMATEIEAARLLTYQAAWLADQRLVRRNDDARDSRANRAWRNFTPERWRCAWRTKPCRFMAATDSSRIIRRKNIYRDVKLCTIGEGTSEIQRLVIARQILGKG